VLNDTKACSVILTCFVHRHIETGGHTLSVGVRCNYRIQTHKIFNIIRKCEKGNSITELHWTMRLCFKYECNKSKLTFLTLRICHNADTRLATDNL
jgi:hypothetical protein